MRVVGTLHGPNRRRISCELFQRGRTEIGAGAGCCTARSDSRRARVPVPKFHTKFRVPVPKFSLELENFTHQIGRCGDTDTRRVERKGRRWRQSLLKRDGTPPSHVPIGQRGGPLRAPTSLCVFPGAPKSGEWTVIDVGRDGGVFQTWKGCGYSHSKLSRSTSRTRARLSRIISKTDRKLKSRMNSVWDHAPISSWDQTQSALLVRVSRESERERERAGLRLENDPWCVVREPLRTARVPSGEPSRCRYIYIYPHTLFSLSEIRNFHTSGRVDL